jgi:hypothetical protein
LDNPTISHLITSHPPTLLLSTQAALCIGIPLIPRLPNVEFTSLFVFLVGAIFGISLGIVLGVFVMFINAFFRLVGLLG